jgi:hypothetical protein
VPLTQVTRWANCRNSAEVWPDEVTKDPANMERDKDFSTKGPDALEFTAVMEAWQSGVLSRDSMMELFRRGEVLPEGRTNEEAAALIARSRVEGPKAVG